jgi:hypothetical protein
VDVEGFHCLGPLFVSRGVKIVAIFCLCSAKIFQGWYGVGILYQEYGGFGTSCYRGTYNMLSCMIDSYIV